MGQLTFRKLRIWNGVVGLLQLIAGVAILVLGPYNEQSKLPWYSSFIGSWSRDSDNAALFYVPVNKMIVEFPIAVWSGAFLLLSAANHLLVTLPGVNSVYNRQQCVNRNPFRWAEYSISASLMTVMIAQLSGVTDIHLLFSLFALMGTTMLFGWVMESTNGERLPCFEYTEDSRAPPAARIDPSKGLPAAFVTDSVYSYGSPLGDGASGSGASVAGAAGGSGSPIDWTPFIFGCVPFLFSSAVVACYFFQAVVNGDPPGFVWSIFFILFFLYCLFAVNQIFQFKQVRGWRGFGAAEWWYIILSITSKQLLAWITYGGTRRFQSEGI